MSGVIRGTRKEKEVALFDRIYAESQEARKRSRNKGRMRVRPGPGRPAMQPTTSPLPALDLGSTAPGPASGTPDRGGLRLTASMGALPGMPGASSSHQGSTAGMDVEIPPKKQVAVDQAARLKVAVQDLRNKVSRTHHAVAVKEAELQKLSNEIKFMDQEDDVAAQRADSQRQLAEKKAELGQLDRKLLETLEYNKVLVYMVKRLERQKLTSQSTLVAYEDALSLTSTEATETEKLLLEVKKVKEDEEAELARMQDAAHLQRKELEERLEKRRQQALQREGVKEWASMSGVLDGDDSVLEPEFEHHSPEQRQRNEVLAALDTERAKFATLLGVAGVYDTDESVYAEKVLQRYSALKTENEHLDAQLEELTAHVEFLQQSEEELRARAQPRSSTRRPSRDFKRETLDKLGMELDAARREHGTAKEEYEQAMTTQVQLEQSVDALMARLSVFVSLPGDAEDAALSDDSPTSEFVRKINAIGRKLVYMNNAITDEISGGAMRLPSRSVALRVESPTTSGVLKRTRSMSSQASAAGTGKERESELATKKVALMEAMETAVLENSNNIRVRPGSPPAAIGSKQITAAVEAFNTVQTRLMSSAGHRSRSRPTSSPPTQPPPVASPSKALAEVGMRLSEVDEEVEAPTKDVLSLEASRRRRRHSRENIAAAFAASTQTAVARAYDAPTRTLPGATRRNKSKQAALVKYATAAVGMAGDDVDDSAGAHKDYELVPDRAMVKHKARMAIQRARKAKK